MKKQDRQGVRTAADLERKYDFRSMGGAGSSEQVSQLNQTLSQYMSKTNATINEMQAKDQELQEMIENSGGGSSSGGTATGILSVEQTTTSTEDDGVNVVTVTLTDGTQTTFEVQNGSKGDKGDPGTGFFSMMVDENGDLYVITNDANDVPVFDYDEETGNLYIVQEV